MQCHILKPYALSPELSVRWQLAHLPGVHPVGREGVDDVGALGAQAGVQQARHAEEEGAPRRLHAAPLLHQDLVALGALRGRGAVFTARIQGFRVYEWLPPSVPRGAGGAGFKGIGVFDVATLSAIQGKGRPAQEVGNFW